MLLLLRNPAAGEPYIRRAIQERKIANERIVFVDRSDIQQYLQTYSLCDVFVDTLVYNGHSTSTSEMLVKCCLCDLSKNKNGPQFVNTSQNVPLCCFIW